MPAPKQKKLATPTIVTQTFSVVAVGASAGGLEAITAILGALPTDIAMAFVLIQHLDPKRQSLLPELLAKATKIPVLEATDSMKLEANRVYVMPSNVDIHLLDGHFALTPRSTGRDGHLPIDIFMRTLAEVHKSQAIGVVLSGTATDGTAGLKAIRAAGGATFAQSPETAKFNGMPQSAIDSGCVDFILSPVKIAEKLNWMSHHPEAKHEPSSPREESKNHEELNNDEQAFDSILTLVSSLQGPDFHEYKPNTIRRRTQQRMASLGLASIAAYRNYLGEHPEEVTRLSNHVLIPVTEFFRNPEVFEDLRGIVYPKIAGKRGFGVVRIWVVACSSGEEAYSLAITLQEYLANAVSTGRNSTRVQIFGTDINEKGIAKARAGVYSENALKNVSEERLANFFTKVDGGYRINKEIRDLCIFARQDVTKDPPFSSMDVISCRNFLIYIQSELQERILSTLHYALKPNGFLLLGNAESANAYTQMFTQVTKQGKIYSKKEMNPTQQRTFKRSQNLTHANALPAVLKQLGNGGDGRKESLVQQQADRLVLKDYAPAGVIVNESLEILNFRGQTSPYLQPASGRATLNLLNMVREELAVPLRTTIALSKKKDAPSQKKNIAFEYAGKKRLVDISVIPLRDSTMTSDCCYLILFQNAPPVAVTTVEKGKRVPSKASDLMQRKLLEQKRELSAARTLLREYLATQEALREDSQASNEELLSANEELQSTNEELETSKEELESANEELTTVNDELNSNNSALHLLGNDLKNLLESTVIPIVMVDRELCIRRVTPMAEKVFRVLPSDVGRPITDIRPELEIELKPLLLKVVQDVVNIEQEVQDPHGHWYRLQVRPYKTLDNHIDGAVLVLLDIDVIKKRNQELIRAGELTKSIIETMPQPVLVLSAEMRILMANDSFYVMFKEKPEMTINQSFYSLHGGLWNRPGLRVLLEEILPQQKNFLYHEVDCDFPGIGAKSFVLSGRYMVQEPDAAPLILLSVTDITQIRRTEAALIQAEKLAIASRMAASIAHEINNPLEAITNLLYLASSDDDPEAAKAYSSQALLEVNRISHITQQTLKFHRQSSSPSLVQISEIVDSLLVLFQGKLQSSKILVDCQFRDDPPILCLAGDLRQIFANIIANAIDAMKSGGRLSIRVSPSVDWRNPKRVGIRTTIADSGTGMNIETRRRIYEPFFTTKGDTGTGLGMWVCAQLVERLKGDMRVWSTTQEGKSGTTFSFFMPFEK